MLIPIRRSIYRLGILSIYLLPTPNHRSKLPLRQRKSPGYASHASISLATSAPELALGGQSADGAGSDSSSTTASASAGPSGDGAEHSGGGDAGEAGRCTYVKIKSLGGVIM